MTEAPDPAFAKPMCVSGIDFMRIVHPGPQRTQCFGVMIPASGSRVIEKEVGPRFRYKRSGFCVAGQSFLPPLSSTMH